MFAGLRLYAYAGAAVLLLAVLAFAGCEHKAATKARLERDQAKAWLSQAVDANTANVEVIAKQAAAIKAWRDLFPTAADAAKAIDAAAAAQEKIDGLNKENFLLRSKDTALPQCVALLNLSLSKPCPGRDVSLHNLSSAARQDGHGRDPNPGH